MGYIGKQPTPTALIASDITDGVIGTDKLSNDAVTEAKIPDGAIENEHLNVNSITGITGRLKTHSRRDISTEVNSWKFSVLCFIKLEFFVKDNSLLL